ncbi:hypothetical protein C6503_01570 [Candidatus Poribacteria bacterium]|nr:MAG: hypothetical protein C6503_01570 [Candidatus Poribacteria bacterium]
MSNPSKYANFTDMQGLASTMICSYTMLVGNFTLVAGTLLQSLMFTARDVCLVPSVAQKCPVGLTHSLVPQRAELAKIGFAAHIAPSDYSGGTADNLSEPPHDALIVVVSCKKQTNWDVFVVKRGPRKLTNNR